MIRAQEEVVGNGYVLRMNRFKRESIVVWFFSDVPDVKLSNENQKNNTNHRVACLLKICILHSQIIYLHEWDKCRRIWNIRTEFWIDVEDPKLRISTRCRFDLKVGFEIRRFDSTGFDANIVEAGNQNFRGANSVESECWKIRIICSMGRRKLYSFFHVK